MSAIYDYSIPNNIVDAHCLFLLKYLRHIANPMNKHIALEMEALSTIESLEYLDSLRLNKLEESKKQPYIN